MLFQADVCDLLAFYWRSSVSLQQSTDVQRQLWSDISSAYRFDELKFIVLGKDASRRRDARNVLARGSLRGTRIDLPELWIGAECHRPDHACGEAVSRPRYDETLVTPLIRTDGVS